MISYQLKNKVNLLLKITISIDNLNRRVLTDQKIKIDERYFYFKTLLSFYFLFSFCFSFKKLFFALLL
jgi:hypothetical protein